MVSEELSTQPLSEKKKRAQTARSVFTRHLNSLRGHLDRWRRDPVSRDLEKVIAEALVQVREYCEKILKIYDIIEADYDVSEQVFTITFKPRMADIVKAL